MSSCGEVGDRAQSLLQSELLSAGVDNGEFEVPNFASHFAGECMTVVQTVLVHFLLLYQHTYKGKDYLAHYSCKLEY